MRWILICALAVASPAFAEGFGLRDGDEAFDPEALSARLSGTTLVFFDDGRSEFYEDGRYTYTYANDGGTAYGYWEVDARGAVCIAYVNGFSRCDLYVMNGDRLILLDEKGDRYPIRP